METQGSRVLVWLEGLLRGSQSGGATHTHCLWHVQRDLVSGSDDVLVRIHAFTPRLAMCEALVFLHGVVPFRVLHLLQPAHTGECMESHGSRALV
jgi:hypothetical protein